MPAKGVPRWFLSLMWADRAVSYINDMTHRIVDRLACLLLEPTARPAVISYLYSRQATYLPGHSFYTSGLMPWELEALTRGPFPQRGHLLLGAAGGGRELIALCELGYSVTAFEPVPQFFAALHAVASNYEDATAVEASFEQLVVHAAGGKTPFEEVLDTKIDGVVLGHCSFSHLTRKTDQLSLLRAIRKVAPYAPALVSYNAERTVRRSPGGRVQSAESILRRLRIATQPLDPSVSFSSHLAFHYTFGLGEFSMLAASAGYRVDFVTETGPPNENVFPYAVIVPESSGEHGRPQH